MKINDIQKKKKKKKNVGNTNFLKKKKKGNCEQNNKTARNEWNLPKTKEVLEIILTEN